MKPILAALILSVLTLTPVLAADKKTTSETPIIKWMDAENALLETLPRANQKVFFIFRNKHSVIRSIEVVHKDIKSAVRSCGKENSDMRKDINSRLKEWEKSVFPILKEAKGFLKKELKEQEAFHASDYNHVMKLNDKAYKFSESKIEKQVVSTKEACEGLLASLDSSEDKLVELLQTILLPEEVVRERLEQAKKAKK